MCGKTVLPPQIARKENKMILTENASTLFFLNIEKPPSAVEILTWLERLKYHHLLILETRFVLWMFSVVFKRRVLNAFSNERVVTAIK